MFDMSLVADLDCSVSALLGASTDLAAPAQSRDALRAVQSAQDRLDAVRAAHLANLEATRGFEEDEASTLSAWARRELRIPASEARTLVAASNTLRMLPLVRRSAAAGRIRLAHIKEFTFGIRHIGAKTIEGNQDWLLDVAETCDPLELHQVLRKLREAIFPEELDRKWSEGMDKEDIAVNAVPDGWHVTGFLGIVTGTKLKTILGALSTPRDRDDKRPAAERRVDALDSMLSAELEHGLPTDLGVRPQLNVTVDVETLLRQRSGESVVPAVELHGFGAIGPKLTSYFVCNSSVTGLLVGGQAEGPGRKGKHKQAAVLNVGRASRIALPKQRKAVLVRQRGICAIPGCTNTHLEIHHVSWWAEHGGRTDLDNLIGLCSRCHHLVHRELLHIRPDGDGGFRFGDGRAVNRSHRTHIRYGRQVREASRLETELTLLLIEQRRQVRPRRNIEYEAPHRELLHAALA